MPTRIAPQRRKKKALEKKKRKQKKAAPKRPGGKGLLRRAAGIVRARKKPEVASGDSEPSFVPMLFFRDVDAAVHFFTVKLGFDLVYQRHTLHGYTGVSAVKFPGVFLLLGHVDGLDSEARAQFETHPRGVGVHFVITVFDIDVFYRELVARGVAVKNQPHVRLWGSKEFTLAEPLEGYVFTFSQPAVA